MSYGTLDPAASYCFPIRGFHPLWPDFPDRSGSKSVRLMQSITPTCTHVGLGSSGFARRYSRNRVFFLFLRLLRCFSSPGSLPYVMDWRMDDGGLLHQVSPFRYLRINGYLPLPEAYRSLSRLSSALSAKASTLRSCSLNLTSGLLRSRPASSYIALYVRYGRNLSVPKCCIYIALLITMADLFLNRPGYLGCLNISRY